MPSEPATKQDLLDLEANLESRLASKQEMRGMEERLIERMRDMQTELLRAFHDWARTVEVKLRRLPEIDERLNILEERIGKIERGDLPPRPH